MSFHWRSDTSPPRRYQASLERMVSSAVATKIGATLPPGLIWIRLAICSYANGILFRMKTSTQEGLVVEKIETGLMRHGFQNGFGIHIKLGLQLLYEGFDVVQLHRRNEVCISRGPVNGRMPPSTRRGSRECLSAQKPR